MASSLYTVASVALLSPAHSVTEGLLDLRLFGCIRRRPISKIKCDVVANQQKGSPPRDFYEAIVSHPFSGLMKRLTGAFTEEQVLVETSHELHCSCVI